MFEVSLNWWTSRIEDALKKQKQYINIWWLPRFCLCCHSPLQYLKHDIMWKGLIARLNAFVKSFICLIFFFRGPFDKNKCDCQKILLALKYWLFYFSYYFFIVCATAKMSPTFLRRCGVSLLFSVCRSKSLCSVGQSAVCGLSVPSEGCVVSHLRVSSPRQNKSRPTLTQSAYHRGHSAVCLPQPHCLWAQLQ